VSLTGKGKGCERIARVYHANNGRILSYTSCPSGKIGGVYGVFDEAAGVDIRGRFIIDPDFVIRAMEVLTPEVGRNPNELLRQIKAFQHVVVTGEVTPSGWEPGDTTLTPGPDLVGKVWEVWKP
jgi:peroxiredoxin (alkyl hydroperoxide reductase subunit C)